MNKILLALAWILTPLAVFSQADLVIKGATPVAIVESGGTAATPIYINIGNPAPAGITMLTAAATNEGYIISENEWDMVKWATGTANTGTYTVPFGYTNATPAYYYLPVSVDIGTVGTGTAASSLVFSTWHTIADQYTGVMSMTGDPHDVTNMGSFWGGAGQPGTGDNSWNAVDRFWVIDPGVTGFAYTTQPTVAANGITFTYISNGGTPSEVISPNTLATLATEQTLLTQRFNSGSHTWGDWLGMGATDNAIAGSTTATARTGVFPPASFYRSWTLASSIDPLPITLSSFTAECNEGSAVLRWTAQTQLNNNYFTVTKTTDGVHFETVGTVVGGGTTSLPANYTLTDNSPYAGTSYYILNQTDFDDNSTQAGNIEFTGCGANGATTVNAYNTTNYIEVEINSIAADNFNISLVNMLGQTIINEYHGVALGSNEIRLNNLYSPGIYILSVRNNSNVNYAKKLVLGIR